MKIEEAIKLLHPDTSADEIAEIKYLKSLSMVMMNKMILNAPIVIMLLVIWTHKIRE